MKKVIIFHGMPEEHEYQGNESKLHWIPWIKSELEKRGYEVHTPELPRPFEPHYEEWKQVFTKIPADDETILIGHSCGAGFFVRYLSENEVNVSKVFLIGPWLDPKAHLKDDFFDFYIDSELVQKTKGVTMFVSLDDEQDVLESAETLVQSIKNITLKQFTNHGHFTEPDMNSKEFPELIEAIIEK